MQGSTTSTGRFASIDFLRGIAILLVMIQHLPFSRAGGLPPYPDSELVQLAMSYGHHGVLLFLVISGFCIHLAWAREADTSKHVPFLPFWQRRLRRLYPPYFIALLGALAATFLLHRAAFAAGAPVHAWFGYDDGGQFWLDMFLLLVLAQNLTDASARVGNGPFWSLALEEQLYMLYFPLLHLRRRLGWRSTLLVTLVVTLLWRGLGTQLKMPSFWFVVAPAFWFAWTLGALSAEIAAGKLKVHPLLSNPLAALGLLGIAIVQDVPHWRDGFGIWATFNALLYGAAFFVLMNWLMARENRGLVPSAVGHWMVRLGVVSYSVYLIHNMAFIASKRALLALGVPDELTLALRFLIGLVAGVIFYKLIEAPFHRWAQNARAAQRTVAATSPTPRELAS